MLDVLLFRIAAKVGGNAHFALSAPSVGRLFPVPVLGDGAFFRLVAAAAPLLKQVN